MQCCLIFQGVKQTPLLPSTSWCSVKFPNFQWYVYCSIDIAQKILHISSLPCLVDSQVSLKYIFIYANMVAPCCVRIGVWPHSCGIMWLVILSDLISNTWHQRGKTLLVWAKIIIPKPIPRHSFFSHVLPLSHYTFFPNYLSIFHLTMFHVGKLQITHIKCHC